MTGERDLEEDFKTILGQKLLKKVVGSDEPETLNTKQLK